MEKEKGQKERQDTRKKEDRNRRGINEVHGDNGEVDGVEIE